MDIFNIERLINIIDTLSDEDQEQIRKKIADNQTRIYNEVRYEEFAKAEEAGTDLPGPTYGKFGVGFIHVQYENSIRMVDK